MATRYAPSDDDDQNSYGIGAALIAVIIYGTFQLAILAAAVCFVFWIVGMLA